MPPCMASPLLECNFERSVKMLHGRTRVLRNLLLAAATLLSSESAVFAQSSITLAWDASTDPKVTGYIVSWGGIVGSYPSSVDVGKVTQYTVTGLDPDRRYSFVVQAYSPAAVSGFSTPVSNNGLIVQTTAAATLPDQRPGIFWRNTDTGQISEWLISGTNVMDTRPLSIDRITDTHWFVAAIGDFNGDGHPDVLWRNSTDGSLAVWFLQNSQVIGTQYLSISHMTDPAWKIVGAGDVDGDGHADIVWQHQTQGWLAVWLMRGATVVGTRYLDIPQISSNNWQIAAVADLNRDGFADLIWRETTQGWLAAWFLKGTAVTYQAYLSQPQVADPAWKLVGAGDPGGVRVPTIVWQNSNDGTIAFWYMNGINMIGGAYTTPPKVDTPSWKIVGSR